MAKVRMTKKQRKLIEKHGWTITDCDYNGGSKGFEFKKYSPAGEDFIFSVEANNPDELVDNIREYYNDFDPEEHVEMWVEARHNGVGGIPSIRRLVEDADDIDSMLEELSIALCQQRYGR